MALSSACSLGLQTGAERLDVDLFLHDDQDADLRIGRAGCEQPGQTGRDFARRRGECTGQDREKREETHEAGNGRRPVALNCRV